MKFTLYYKHSKDIKKNLLEIEAELVNIASGDIIVYTRQNIEVLNENLIGTENGCNMYELDANEIIDSVIGDWPKASGKPSSAEPTKNIAGTVVTVEDALKELLAAGIILNPLKGRMLAIANTVKAKGFYDLLEKLDTKTKWRKYEGIADASIKALEKVYSVANVELKE